MHLTSVHFSFNNPSALLSCRLEIRYSVSLLDWGSGLILLVKGDPREPLKGDNMVPGLGHPAADYS